MKKFFMATMVALTLSHSPSQACIFETTHNYYLFDVCEDNYYADMGFGERTNEFWKQYTGGLYSTYLYEQDEIMAVARQKGDSEMVDYLTELNSYLAISKQLQETWSYPTKNELEQRRQTLLGMLRKARAYQGTRLRGQWSLLLMRANMVMGQDKANVDYWQQTGQRLSAGVYRDMMENIYAGALMKLGQRQAAIELFARQGDFESIKWALRTERNLGGIKRMYELMPNTRVLSFLVEDFVNNVQETLDQKWNDQDGDGWILEIDRRPIQEQEAMQFIDFARRVIAEKKTQSPALWQAAIGELQMLCGQADKAVETLTEAMLMNGTQRMRDNARAIRSVALVEAHAGMLPDKKFARQMATELAWIRSVAQPQVNGTTQEDGHYLRVADRLVYQHLSPYYLKQGQAEMAAALMGMMSQKPGFWQMDNVTAAAGDTSEVSYYNPGYDEADEYVDYLSGLSGDGLVAYGQWCEARPKDDLEAMAKKALGKQDVYLADMAATHYMAEGQWAKAVPLLRRVPLSFMEGQNISYYLAHRDFTVPRWLKRQSFARDLVTDGPHLARLSDNAKLRFCEEVMGLEQQFGLARVGQREQLAYDLAVRYLQASNLGDCWYLTHYGWSVGSYVEEGEADLPRMAVEMLKESSQSGDFRLREASIYGLAFIADEPWATTDFDWETGKTSYNLIPDNRQFGALASLSRFERQNHERVSGFVTKCDVLKQFRKATGK